MYFKAFALSGRRAKCCLYPGCCPGLGASALSGRVGHSLCFQGVWGIASAFQGAWGVAFAFCIASAIFFGSKTT